MAHDFDPKTQDKPNFWFKGVDTWKNKAKGNLSARRAVEMLSADEMEEEIDENASIPAKFLE